jgi:hypothetical protein
VHSGFYRQMLVTVDDGMDIIVGHSAHVSSKVEHFVAPAGGASAAAGRGLRSQARGRLPQLLHGGRW